MNASALFHVNPSKRNRKRNFLHKLSLDCSAVLLQETHGHFEDLLVAFPGMRSKFHVPASGYENIAAGGALTLISKAWCPEARAIGMTSLAPGRVTRTTVTDTDHDGIEMRIWNVHNFALPPRTFDPIRELLSSDLSFAQAHPTQCMVIVGGDFNFYMPMDRPFRPERAGQDEGAQREAAPRALQAFWTNILRDTTDVANTEPTHYYVAGNTFARIDRLNFSTPPWMLANIAVDAPSGGDLGKFYAAGLIDHIPVTAVVSPRQPLPPGHRPIKKFVFKSAVFAELHEAYIQNIPLDGMPAIMRWGTHKTILQEVGRRARNALIEGTLDDPDVLLLCLNSVARAVTKHDLSLGRALLDSSSTARRHIRIHFGKIDLFDP